MEQDLLSLGQELAEITRLVEDDDLETMLRRYVTRMARTVPGCDQALISIAGASGPGDAPPRIETIAGSDDPDLVDGWRDPTDVANPITDVLTYHEPRRLADIREDPRWPEFAERVADAGYLSALVLPLSVNSEPAAAMTLLSRKADQFADTSFDLAMLFVIHAGVVIDNVSLYEDSQSMVRHLRAALVTRSTIGQAQGLLAHRWSCGVDTAFAALRRASQHANVKLRDLAATLVKAHEENRLDAALREAGLGNG